MKKLFYVFGAFIFLGGCKTPVPVTHSISPYGVDIALNVGDFLIVNDVDMQPVAKTRIYPNSLASEVQIWANMRLKSVGSQGKAIFRILDARVTENNIDEMIKNPDAVGSLTANVIVSLEVSDAPGTDVAKMELRFSEELSLSAAEFVAENRAYVWQKFVQRILNELNKTFEDRLLEQMPTLAIMKPKVE